MSEQLEGRVGDALTLTAAPTGRGRYDIADHIEDVRMPLRIGGDGGGPNRIDATDRFPAPVDACWRFHAESVAPLCTADMYVRTPDNAVVDAATTDGSARVPPGPHVIELSTAPMKTYFAVEGPALVGYDDRYPHVRFDGGPAEVVVGARSRHETPVGTITTTDDPADLATAISLFGSALVTTSPERSFPTLRGHPPLLEVGDRFDVPPLVSRVDTGVELGLPFEYGPLFSAAPLAYYLGAGIVESGAPYLAAANVRYDLPASPEELAAELGRLLRHCFTLDCATRACSAGLYDVNLDVHEALTDRLDPPWEAWYRAALDERTARYLEVPTAATLEYIDWPQTTDVKPVATNASILPFLAADLSAVRSPPPTPTVSGGERSTELDDFLRGCRPTATRGADVRPRSATAAGTFTRGPTQNAIEESDETVSPRAADSVSRAWVGPGFPTSAAKPTVEAYRRRFDRSPSADLTIDVTVVCNDERMREEMDDGYGFRDHVAFDVQNEHDLTVAELRDLLRADHDFFHYIGHVDGRGMECSDGFLDLRELDGTGVDAFLLNACSSYKQGMALVEAGALGGVVSLMELPNTLATRVGRDLARLFDAGFPLDAALDVVRRGPFAGSAYTIVGDPRAQLCQNPTGAAMVVRFVDIDEETARVAPRYYPTLSFDIGSMTNPHYANTGCQYVSSGEPAELELDIDTLDRLFGTRIPILIRDRLYWADEVSVDELVSLRDPQ
ncbi:hypothetical protein [Candidatus Halobonum tyrrellensis]|uniref:CHAT domain-containing protein n=1 Tax=Candidatus Halobonum tyrrellensis G22 TaxID=1324957 RepID=V4HGC0_9EURY|nr:hypothetical protein [Candidatus Halobonum tyrrellensis]ESP89163.1 hypothetical protein K933_05243 [Candidatus Halobonum tyrrellensis G22]